jgi:hypothetical protein
MLYTPRCGSTSILRYFKKIKPEFEIINQPWSKAISELENRKQLKYSDIIKKNNIFVKSTINVIFELKFSILNIKNDFDKIIILDRKDTKEQLESYAWAEKHKSFLESSKYLMDYNLDSNTYEICNNILLREKTKIEFLKKELNAKLFYYEDLYYGNFDKLFSYLEIDYLEEYYKMFLDIKNRYRLNDSDIKTIKTLM